MVIGIGECPRALGVHQATDEMQPSFIRYCIVRTLAAS
jgi:hypothetical protein